MISLYKNIFRLIILILVQIIILNRIQLGGYLNPYIYILFILLLPFETPKWSLLVWAFVLGICIDIFSNTLGINASATVFMAYLRPYILNYISQREEYESGTSPGIFYGFVWFLKYSFLLIFVHHLFLFTVEAFSLSNFFDILKRVFASTLFTLSIVIISQFFMIKKQGKFIRL